MSSSFLLFLLLLPLSMTFGFFTPTTLCNSRRPSIPLLISSSSDLQHYDFAADQFNNQNDNEHDLFPQEEVDLVDYQVQIQQLQQQLLAQQEQQQQERPVFHILNDLRHELYTAQQQLQHVQEAQQSQVEVLKQNYEDKLTTQRQELRYAQDCMEHALDRVADLRARVDELEGERKSIRRSVVNVLRAVWGKLFGVRRKRISIFLPQES